MFKKFDEDRMTHILETGIDEFAVTGLDRANINEIAKKAGVSVGVIYKYYGDKDSFFLACVRFSLNLLRDVLDTAAGCSSDLQESMHGVICALVEHSRKHSNYYVMYNEITSGSCRKYAAVLAEEIESMSSAVYTRLLENAKDTGKVRSDMDCRMFAFFFDNLLMMLQFSYCCEYYKERMKIYCGEDILGDDEKMIREMMSFMSAAMGL